VPARYVGRKLRHSPEGRAVEKLDAVQNWALPVTSLGMGYESSRHLVLPPSYLGGSANVSRFLFLDIIEDLEQV
jgi:hypothetical protein